MHNSTKNRYFGGGDEATNFHIKETLIAWNIFGRGNEDMAPEEEQLSNFVGFQQVFRNVLPPTLGFKKLSIRNMEIVMESDTGEFLIDAASGGLSSLIDLAWQIYMFQPGEDGSFTVLIDEVENHLHPTMQRRVLPDLLEAFPNVRFIVATHAPLIVGSVKSSKVYALRYDQHSLVVSHELDLVNEARTAAQVLDEVLGVSVTMPIWAEEALSRIVQEFTATEITKESLDRLRLKLKQEGLSQFLPDTISRMTEDYQ